MKTDRSSNSVAIAGEFAVLSQLAFRGFDANLTLGNTKSVDILVAHSKTGKMSKLEVKTNCGQGKNAGGNSRLFGKFVHSWMMSEKHEEWIDPNLFYCFVHIDATENASRFFVVPSQVVARYVKEQHQIWLDEKESHSRKTKMRTFRIGLKGEKYPISTPTIEDHENKWDFLR